MEFIDVKREMRDFNKKHGIVRKALVKKNADGETITMVAKVVIKESVLNPVFAPYSVESRTYVFDNYNKALTSEDLGYSIFAYNEKDDDMLRIESYDNFDFESVEIIKVVE